jgi:hypothetical protein
MKIFFACFLVVGVIAAIAYYLHGSYLLGQLDSAIATTYELVAAETRFAKAHPDRGYTCDLSQLIKEVAQFEGAQTLGRSGQRSGYSFVIKGCEKHINGKANVTYEIIARPLRGSGNVCADQTGRVWFYDAKCDQE